MIKKKIEDFLKGRLSAEQFEKARRVYKKVKSIPAANNLTRIADIYGTDKTGVHFYTTHYQHHFKHLKFKRIKLLEIGVGGYASPTEGGRSLRMWKEYFPFAQIFALDIYDKSRHEEKRIKIFQGSQVDEQFLQDVVAHTGPLDLIIDDGSHINEHVITSFEILFPHLKTGGIYVVEDVQTSYWDDYGGDSTDLQRPGTIMNYFKALTDSLNYQEFVIPGYQPTYYDKHIVSMHFYHNMIFIYKGNNDELSNMVKDNIRIK